MPSGTETSHNGSNVAQLRDPGLSWDGGSHNANRNGSGDVQGLCSNAQALIPVLDVAPSGFPSHASVRDALQAVHRTREAFGPISGAQLWVTANTDSECWRLLCKHVCNFARTRAVIEDGAFKSTVAQIKLPVNAGGDVCAQVAGGELETAAKTVTVPTSPTEVQAMFVGFDDDRPQVHEVGSSTESEVHITSTKCSCERCKISSLSAAPSSSEFCGWTLLLASKEPPPFSHASETCCDTWEIAVASLEDLPMPSVSRSCADLWKTAIASLEPPPSPSASRGGQGQCQKKRSVIGVVLKKPAAQAQTTPEEPSLDELEGPFTLVRRGKSQSRLAEAYILQKRGKLPRWVAGQPESRSQHVLENVAELKNCLEHGAITRRADAQSWLSQLPWETFLIVTRKELNQRSRIGTARDHAQLETHRRPFANHPYSTQL